MSQAVRSCAEQPLHRSETVGQSRMAQEKKARTSAAQARTPQTRYSHMRQIQAQRGTRTPSATITHSSQTL